MKTTSTPSEPTAAAAPRFGSEALRAVFVACASALAVGVSVTGLVIAFDFPFAEAWTELLPHAFAGFLAAGMVALALALLERHAAGRWGRVLVGAVPIVVLGQLAYSAQVAYFDGVLYRSCTLVGGMQVGASAVRGTSSLWTSPYGQLMLAFQWAGVVVVSVATAASLRLRTQLVLGFATVVGCYMAFQTYRQVGFYGMALGAEAHVFLRPLLFPCAAAAADALARRAAPELGSASGRFALS